MKKLVLLVVILLVLPFVAASDVRMSVRLGDYGYVSGPDMHSYVYIWNGGDSKLRDGYVSIRFVDDGLYDSSRSVSIRKNNGFGYNLYTPLDDVSPGEYLVKITYRSKDTRRVKYRYVFVY